MAEPKILLAGDVMLDHYVYGDVSRISPEAPIAVLREQKGREKFVPGGAANVAMNLRAAGVEVDLLSVIGKDEAGTRLKEMLSSSGIGTGYICETEIRPTTTKLRYIGQNNQQVFRVDTEETSPLTMKEFASYPEQVKKGIRQYDLVILSDYDKGVLSEEVCRYLTDLGRQYNLPVFVDVKGTHSSRYKGATLIKPNRSELHGLTDLPVATAEEVAAASKHLTEVCDCRYVLATLGADGMFLYDREGASRHIKTAAKEVYDVTGAGDTSLAYLAAAFVHGSSMEEAVETANLAAGVQVSKTGTGTVYPEEVERARIAAGVPLMEKQLNFYRAGGLSALEKIREKGAKIVFTNGCFDILHAGHVRYLSEAKKLGDCLVIGVNSDASVSRLKGEGRPVNHISDRLMLLAALECVDFVITFEEDTPYDLIRAIRPDVLVKGGDYKPEDIVGADIVAEYGGTVTTVPYVEGLSTTGLIDRMKKQ